MILRSAVILSRTLQHASPQPSTRRHPSEHHRAAKQTRPSAARRGTPRRPPEPAQTAARRRPYHRAVLGGLVAGGAVVGLFLAFRSSGGANPAAYPYQVAAPGPGRAAPGFTLASTTGQPLSLSAFRGRTVMLYFQEGLTCQPCWDQLSALDHSTPQLRRLGIDQVVTITTDPANLLAQKVSDQAITTPVLSDPTLAISSAYHANSYGMMGTTRDGHSFVVVGPQGKILWRADFGGPTRFIMDVPVPVLMNDLARGLHH